MAAAGNNDRNGIYPIFRIDARINPLAHNYYIITPFSLKNGTL